jgi:hypothetical protein
LASDTQLIGHVFNVLVSINAIVGAQVTTIPMCHRLVHMVTETVAIQLTAITHLKQTNQAQLYDQQQLQQQLDNNKMECTTQQSTIDQLNHNIANQQSTIVQLQTDAAAASDAKTALGQQLSAAESATNDATTELNDTTTQLMTLRSAYGPLQTELQAVTATAANQLAEITHLKHTNQDQLRDQTQLQQQLADVKQLLNDTMTSQANTEEQLRLATAKLGRLMLVKGVNGDRNETNGYTHQSTKRRKPNWTDVGYVRGYTDHPPSSGRYIQSRYVDTNSDALLWHDQLDFDRK